MQQHVEALGEILLALAHGARNVHQAEHDGGGRFDRRRLKGVVAHVKRVDEGHVAPALLHRLQPIDDLQFLGDLLLRRLRDRLKREQPRF